ncbi:hypothetical protein F0562_015605 [Nyssa sinensis]|uniref:Glycosyltransferase n=1 Tax=Nyssa sinensis TaxID=561372 RepID=A0A5J4ZM23_9ASTE|nr:hypothetical protein F0562_015605 [Nyssa sinensis]
MADHHHQNHGLKQAQQVVVVMVPFPAQGHLNQLLQLSRLVSSYNIPVHYVSSATHNRQAKLRVHGWNPLAVANVHFHESPTPSFLSPLPNPNSSIPFPSHLQPAFDASLHLREPVATLLRTLSPTAGRLIVIHDSLMSSVAQDVVSIPNAEFTKFINSQHDYMKFDSGRLYNTCQVMEGPYLDLLAREEMSRKKKQWAFGPFNPVTISDNKKSNHRHKCLKWLDKQGENSVICVSFGTTTSLTNEQIKELAVGLEQSRQKFIWVLRDADKGDVFAGEERRVELPKGYEERVKGKGIVVRDWAPQLEILGHPSTGGFMSHCGWNSCVESLSMGVPIAAWPMHSDQPNNTVLITKLLKVGLVVKDWARRDELVTSLMVEKDVKKLMASKEGDEVRRRAADLGGAIRRSVAEGGQSRMELDSFIIHITR